MTTALLSLRRLGEGLLKQTVCGLLCMASVGEYENNLTLPPSGGSEGEGLSSHTDMNLTFKVVLLGVQG